MNTGGWPRGRRTSVWRSPSSWPTTTSSSCAPRSPRAWKRLALESGEAGTWAACVARRLSMTISFGAKPHRTVARQNAMVIRDEIDGRRVSSGSTKCSMSRSSSSFSGVGGGSFRPRCSAGAPAGVRRDGCAPHQAAYDSMWYFARHLAGLVPDLDHRLVLPQCGSRPRAVPRGARHRMWNRICRRQGSTVDCLASTSIRYSPGTRLETKIGTE